MHQFTITDKIKSLDIQDITENLFHYSYDSKSLKALVKSNTSKEDILAQAKALPEVQQFLTGPTKKEIVVPNKLVNLVV